MNRETKVVNKLISITWEMKSAKESLERREESRVEILKDALLEKCSCETERAWQKCARELLKMNCVTQEEFRASVQERLEKGRGKYRNIILTGPANCGKTFLLNPLNKIYRTFTNPASTSFAWVGAENAEAIFLNDFRWSPQIIPWQDFLLLLEDHVVHLPTPKSHFAKDIKFDTDTPIFCTSKQSLIMVKNGSLDERETEMAPDSSRKATGNATVFFLFR